MDRAEALARLEPSLVDLFLGAVNSNPDAVRDTLGALASDPVTVEPVTDYVTDLDERCRLFRDLMQTYREYDEPSRLNAAILAVVMVAPIPEIRSSISAIRESLHSPVMQIGMNSLGPAAVRSCTFPHPHPPSQPLPLTLP